jgi:hypothetical protein
LTEKGSYDSTMFARSDFQSTEIEHKIEISIHSRKKPTPFLPASYNYKFSPSHGIDVESHIPPPPPPSLITRQCFSRGRVVGTKPHREYRTTVAVGKESIQSVVSKLLLFGFLRNFRCGALLR